MPTPRVDLTRVDLLSQLVLRAGNIGDPRAQQVAREQYIRTNTNYTDLKVGLSCLFHPGASLDELAREGFFPNARLSAATIQQLASELATIGCEPALYVTPVIPRYPNHHTLVFFRSGMLELTLQDDVLQARVRAMKNVRNPHQQLKPGRQTMQQTFLDTSLWPQETDSTWGEGFYVGLTSEPRFADITEGQQVVLRDIDIGIDAVMHKVIAPSGDEWWFGQIVGTEYHQVPEQPLETPAATQQEH